MTSRILASGNTLVLHAAQLDSTISSEAVDQANFIHDQTMELDKFIGDLMADIVKLSHEDNLQAIGANGLIDLDKASYLDNHQSTETVIFGNEAEAGAGKSLLESLESHKALLMTHAGPDLDRIIQDMLLLESDKYTDDVSWL
jgi:hypothetical protein